jgi:hypothetical protein
MRRGTEKGFQEIVDCCGLLHPVGMAQPGIIGETHGG